MEGRHLNRKRDKDNPYNIYETEGHYFISFKDGQAESHNFEISRTLYEAFDSFELEDIRYLNVLSRHIEHSEIWESKLNMRVLHKPEDLEETVIENFQIEKLYTAIQALPALQRRRLVLHFFEDMTYEQIARLDKCTHPAVIKSVKTALNNLKKLLE